MKKFLTLILLSVALYSNATTYYISPSGNDGTGNGTVGNPWKTLFKATSTVTASGDIIHVNAGTYTETAQCQLAVGVSIEGDGITSILRSTLTALYTPIILAASTQGTNGNQHISFLKMEGQMTTQWAISVQGRSNFSIHDITAIDFFDRGIVITGAYNTPLSIYATGNTFYNNIVTNCGQNNGNGYGCLMIGGQDGILIHDNVITQDSRPDGLNGWPIKYMDEGHYKNMKIYNNTFNKNPQSGQKAYIDWNFVMELFNLEGGNEIYNNDCVGGGIDLVFLTKGASTYSVWVHDNTVRMLTPNPSAFQMGVTCENEVPAYAPGQPNTLQIADVIIEHNTFTNLSVGVQFTERPGTFMHDITIKNNLFRDHASTGQAGFFIDLGSNGGTITMNNINIYNNTMFTAPGYPMYVGISLPSFMTGGTINGINIKNNNMGGTTAGSVLSQNNTIPINNLNVSNNNFYSNNIDVDIRTPSTVTNYVNANNIHVVPTYGSNYTLLSGSPLIDAGVNVGIAYSGAAPDMGYAEFIVGGNVAPSANAGADRTIVLPKDSVQLHGSGSDVSPGVITAYAWTRISGPNTPTLAGATTPNLTITGMIQGTYIYRLTVTDDSLVNNTGYDEVTITVNPIAGNAPPVANAGNNQTITLPANSTTLSGSGTDSDGTIASYAWTKVSGPAGGIITSPSTAITTITGLVQGVYVFRLTVTDNLGATGFANVQITVNAAGNTPPTSNAGPDQSITLPTNTVNLSGSGTDANGTITAYLWTKVSGPASGTITTATSAATTVTGLVQGVYKFELRVTDNGGAFGRDTMQVTVNAAGNVPPVAKAGPDQSITLPTNTVNLSGSGTDANGTITAYLWTKVSGPAGAGTITNAASAATSVTALIAGIYKFELKVTDNNGATGTDTMQVIVFAPNLAPVANAGLDQSISLPTNTANLSGSGTDTDGTIAAYKWTKISGPAGETITNSTLSGTTVSGLSAGVYVFELKVTDNNGATGTDMMQVTVNPENIPPVANAGPDQSIILPTNSVTLTGRGTDVDGTIVSFKWRQVSGPVDKLTSINTAVTVLDNLIEGTYKLELTVTDNKGATGKDTVSVNVANVTVPTQNKIKVYPNPIVDFTTLEINSTNTIDNSPLLVVVTDMQGKTVYTKQLTAGSYTVKEKLLLSNLSNGTYLITVYFSSSDKQTITAIKL